MKALRTRLMRLEGDGKQGDFCPLFLLDDFASDKHDNVIEDLSIRALEVQRAGQPTETFWRQPGETLTELRLRGAVALGVRYPQWTIAVEVRDPSMAPTA